MILCSSIIPAPQHIPSKSIYAIHIIMIIISTRKDSKQTISTKYFNFLFVDSIHIIIIIILSITWKTFLMEVTWMLNNICNGGEFYFTKKHKKKKSSLSQNEQTLSPGLFCKNPPTETAKYLVSSNCLLFRAPAVSVTTSHRIKHSFWISNAFKESEGKF